MNPATILSRILDALAKAGVPAMLTGSLASSFHGIPRSTQDIDLVIEGNRTQILALVRDLVAQGFYASEAAAREALATRGQFNVIDPATGWKVDLILRKDRAFSREEFRRRRRERRSVRAST